MIRTPVGPAHRPRGSEILTPMPFSPGDHVLVQSLGKGTVREVRRGRCVVEIKGRSLLIDERQLSAPDTVRVKSPRRIAEPPADPESPRTHGSGTLDLHGLTTVDAEGALAAFLNDAMLAGVAEVRVIHGRSGGRLKAMVEARLRSLPSVRAFRLDPRNPGVTIVTL
jgi:DNA mismatch repair protein MutS2